MKIYSLHLISRCLSFLFSLSYSGCPLSIFGIKSLSHLSLKYSITFFTLFYQNQLFHLKLRATQECGHLEWDGMSTTFKQNVVNIAPINRIFCCMYPSASSWPIENKFPCNSRICLTPFNFIIDPLDVVTFTFSISTLYKSMISARCIFPNFSEMWSSIISTLLNKWNDAPESHTHNSIGLLTFKTNVSPSSSDVVAFDVLFFWTSFL